MKGEDGDAQEPSGRGGSGNTSALGDTDSVFDVLSVLLVAMCTLFLLSGAIIVAHSVFAHARRALVTHRAANGAPPAKPRQARLVGVVEMIRARTGRRKGAELVTSNRGDGDTAAAVLQHEAPAFVSKNPMHARRGRRRRGSSDRRLRTRSRSSSGESGGEGAAIELIQPPAWATPNPMFVHAQRGGRRRSRGALRGATRNAKARTSSDQQHRASAPRVNEVQKNGAVPAGVDHGKQTFSPLRKAEKV